MTPLPDAFIYRHSAAVVRVGRDDNRWQRDLGRSTAHLDHLYDICLQRHGTVAGRPVQSLALIAVKATVQCEPAHTHATAS